MDWELERLYNLLLKDGYCVRRYNLDDVGCLNIALVKPSDSKRFYFSLDAELTPIEQEKNGA